MEGRGCRAPDGRGGRQGRARRAWRARAWPRRWDGAVARCKLVTASSLGQLVIGRDALACGAAALFAGYEQGRGEKEEREERSQIVFD